MGLLAAEGVRLKVFSPPYERFESTDLLDPATPPCGRALIWWLVDGHTQTEEFEGLQDRPHGMPLIVLLPAASDIGRTLPLLNRVLDLAPRSVLPAPYLGTPEHLRQVLATPPRSLSDATIRYLRRRALLTDPILEQEVRRIFDLAADTASVTRLARRMYTSRRTLGRHFAAAHLPVPSHWLQFARLLHVAVQLQNETSAVFRIATRAGYPDGFTMSNQMKRMIGHRPTEVRAWLGWEWIVEAWLRQEAERGQLGQE
jgi:AraC-like DNA-binding protein